MKMVAKSSSSESNECSSHEEAVVAIKTMIYKTPSTEKEREEEEVDRNIIMSTKSTSTTRHNRSRRLLHFKDALFNRQNELDILHNAYQRSRIRNSNPTKVSSSSSNKKKKNRSKIRKEDLGISTNESANEGGCSSSAVFISGRAGSGKSCLVREFQKQIRRKDAEEENVMDEQQPHPYFLCSKFNELDGEGNPFSAFTEALEGFCQQALHNIQDEETEFKAIRDAINNSLKGKESSKLLIPIIPSLSKFLSTTTTTNCDVGDEKSIAASSKVLPENNNNKNKSAQRLLYCFKNFISSICTKERPVIMFLDDLQWADKSSIQLISNLLINHDSVSNFMFIGAYRSSSDNVDVDDDDGRTEADSDRSTLSESLSSIEQYKHIDRIQLHNLSKDELAEFFADTLETDIEDTKPLASLVWEKTEGNIFFSKQVLEELYTEQLIVPHFEEDGVGQQQWRWNIDEIDLDAIVPHGVRQAVTSNIMSLPKKQQMVLALAALMKFKFDLDTLLVVMKASGVHITSEELAKLLELAVFRGLLLNSTGSQVYTFAHERIKDAALTLLMDDEDKYDSTRLCIAMALLRRGQSPYVGKDWMLFVAADHLNTITNHKMTPYEMVKLNLCVGEKAAEVAAFGSASRYLNKGIESLSKVGSSYWRKNYDLSKRLYQAAADMEFCLGNFERGTQLCKIIIKHAKSEEDKLFPYYSIADSLGRQGRHSESLQTHLKALYLVGEFPKHFQTLFSSFSMGKAMRLLNKTSDYEFLLLPRMTDKHKLAIMDHLHFTMIRAYNCNNIPVALMAIQKSILLSFQHGISLHTAKAFSSCGSLLFGVLKNYSLGLRLTKLAMDIVLATEAPESPKQKEAVCSVLTFSTSYVDLYSKPVVGCMETLREAEKFGFESGDFESAFRASCMINVIAYVLGLSLHSVQESGAKLVKQLELHKVDAILITFNEYMMLIEHMTNKGRLSIDWGNFHQDLVPAGNVDALLVNVWCYWARLQVAYYFGRYETAELIIKKFEAHGSFENSFAIATIRVFFTGLTYAALARKTKNKQYLSLAKKALDEAHVITKKKGSNNVHRSDILEADILSCNSSAELSTVIFAFDKAIESSKKAGVLQDMALANELAGEFCLNRNNKYRATMYLSKAHRLYLEWGADGKAKYLKRIHGDNIQAIASSQGSARSSSPIGSDRASARTVPRHNGLLGKVPCDDPDDGSCDPALHSSNDDDFSVSDISKLTSPSMAEFRPKPKGGLPPPSETCSISNDS